MDEPAYRIWGRIYALGRVLLSQRNRNGYQLSPTDFKSFQEHPRNCCSWGLGPHVLLKNVLGNNRGAWLMAQNVWNAGPRILLTKNG